MNGTAAADTPKSAVISLDFTNGLFDALERVAGWLRGAMNLPVAQRKRYRDVLSDTYQLVDSVLTMILLRLGEIERLEDGDLLAAARLLDDYNGWLTVERDLRLCNNLRTTLSEARGMNAVAGQASVKDWPELVRKMEDLLDGEQMVAGKISEMLSEISSAARDPACDPAMLRQDIVKARQTLKNERHKFIENELELGRAI